MGIREGPYLGGSRDEMESRVQGDMPKSSLLLIKAFCQHESEEGLPKGSQDQTRRCVLKGPKEGDTGVRTKPPHLSSIYFPDHITPREAACALWHAKPSVSRAHSSPWEHHGPATA